MKQASYLYEIFLAGQSPKAADWQVWLGLVRHHLGLHRRFQIELRQTGATLHYYLRSPKALPLSLGTAQFLLSPLTQLELLSAQPKVGFYPNSAEANFAVLRRQLQRRQRELLSLELDFSPGLELLGHATITFRNLRRQILNRQRLLFFNPLTLLAIDFQQELDLCYKKIPKYLKIDKNLSLLQTASDSSLFQVDTFPYDNQNTFLSLDSYDFARHSLVIGASGCGKSKFLALLIDRIAQQDAEQTRVVVIDPHDRIKADLGSIPQQSVIDFRTLERSIDLFCNHASDTNASVELMLSLFRTLICEGYNGRLERVLRFSSFLLIAHGDFSFLSLRRLLTDLEYRNQLVTAMAEQIPASVSQFFLADFNELRIKAYDESIAPIIAFIDEMQMLPVFSETAPLPSLNTLLDQNFLSIFSLNTLSLGQTVTRTIAGLLFQQLFLFAQSKSPEQRLIVIVDEVAVVESPILARFLSELRKYQTSLILAGQYFEQISPALCSAILANVGNYYLFRTSKTDAKLFIENLEIKTQGSADDAEKFLTGLKTQECLVRVAKGETLYPVMKAKTLTYEPVNASVTTHHPAASISSQPVKTSTKPTKTSSAAANKLSQTSNTSSETQNTLVEAQKTPSESKITPAKTPPAPVTPENSSAQAPNTLPKSYNTSKLDCQFDFDGVDFAAIMQEITTGYGQEDQHA